MDIVRYRFPNADLHFTGVHTGLLLNTGYKHHHLIFMDAAGLTITKIPATERLVPAKVKSESSALSRFKAAARSFGCTKAAARALGIRRFKAID